MKIEITHRFTATHQHRIPPGVMSERHSHDWVWTVILENGIDLAYGWVADFDSVRVHLASCAPEHFDGTTEQLLVALVHELAWRLPVGGAVVTWARLEEKPGQAAIWEVPHA